MKKLLLLFAMAGSLAVGAETKKKAPSEDWKTFSHKYGFTIQLPDYFKEGDLTASAIQYYSADMLNAGEGYWLYVETTRGGSKASLLKDYESELKYTPGIKYKTQSENGFEVSGQNSDGVFYHKTVLKNNQTYNLVINYPSSKIAAMERIIPHITSSFK